MKELDTTVVDSLLGIEDDMVLAGLAEQIGKMPAHQAKTAIRRFANRKVKKAFQNSLLTRGQRYLVASSSKLPKQIQTDISEGNSTFEAKDHYIRKQLTGGTNQELIISSESESVGQRSVDKANLSHVSPTVITKIRLAYAYDASDTDPGNKRYTNAQDAETGGSSPTNVPLAFLNGEVEFSAGGKTFYKGPVKRFFRDSLSVSGQVEGASDSVEIKPQLVLPGQTVQVEIRYALDSAGSAIALDSGKHFCEVRWFTDVVKIK